VLPIAQGRVWTGAKAKELGLVDELGGLDAALAEARTLSKVDAAVGLETYPPAPTLRDVLKSFDGGDGGLGAKMSEALAAAGAIDPAVATEATRLVELALSFRATTIQAVAVLPILR
jgi:protease-4